MKISQIIKALREAKAKHGDVEGLIEVANTDSDCVTYEMKPVGEVSAEHREGHGVSVAFLI